MERFKRATASRHTPIAHLQTTRECDAVVHTATPHHSLSSLLSPLTHASLSHNSTAPPHWPDLLASLSASLKSPSHPDSLVANYAAALEQVTAIAAHDHLTAPLAVFLCIWVCEPDLVKSLATLADCVRKNALQGTASYVAAVEAAPPHVLLLCRKASRQDEAARNAAIAHATHEYGADHVHLVVLSKEEVGTTDSPKAVAALIDRIVEARLHQLVEEVGGEADKLRKASRTFRSWFSTAAAKRTEFEVSDEIVGGRKLSIGGAVTPMFVGDSLEARTRHLGDLYMLGGRYGDALECYRLLQGDLKGLSGPGLVHEAAAYEMGALALALVDGSKQGVGSAMERAIQVYCKAGRRELAVRATLRAVDFCLEAGFPDSAAGVILRAVEVIMPKGVPFGGNLSPSGGVFVETALAVLHTACSEAYRKMRKRRRASLYAFLAGVRFGKMKHWVAAACVVGGIDEAALLRKGLRDDVELIMGAAEAAEGRHARAVGHYIRVLAWADERTDVEIQSTAIQGFLDSIAKGAADAMRRRWDAGVMFPPVDISKVRVSTYDSSDGEPVEWRQLEDDVLEDFDFFAALREVKQGEPVPKRERRLESVIADLRTKRDSGDSSDPGGSLEMKIKRMRELDEYRRKRRRSQSLLERGAIVGERIRLHLPLRNPMLFPVFVKNFCAVATADGNCYDSGRFQESKTADATGDTKDPVEFIPVDDITLGPHELQTVTIEAISRKPCAMKFLGVTWDFTIGMGGASPMASGNSSSTVPGFCILERRGRRLNSTRKQRASEVPLYENDESLTVNVAALEPKLAVTVQSTDMEYENRFESLILRAGETRRAKLILQNDGKIPLEDIVVRVGTPQTMFVDLRPRQVTLDGKDVMLAIDSDDELVGPDGISVSTCMSVSLQCNETVEVGMWLRAAVPNAAFSYRRSAKHGKRSHKRPSEAELDEEGMLPCKLKMAIAYGRLGRRMCRFGSSFRVQPSILVSPRFLRPADSYVLPKGNFWGVLLGLEVEHGGQNIAENLVFQITEVSVTSRTGWKPVSLHEPSKCNGDVPQEIEQSKASMRINETATLFFLVVQEKGGAVLDDANSLNSQNHWQTACIDLSSTRAAEEQQKLAADTGEHLSSSTAMREPQNAQQRASTNFVICANSGAVSAASAAKDRSRELIYVSLGWRNASKARGQIHVPPIDPLKWMARGSTSPPDTNDASPPIHDAVSVEGPPPALECENSSSESGAVSHPIRQGNWITVKVQHPDILEHCFLKNAAGGSPITEGSMAGPNPAVVAVDVYVKNVGPYLLDVVFAAPTENEISDGERGRYWAGDVAMSLRALPPGAERVVHLSAVLLWPGRYNMSNFTIVFQSCGYAEGTIRKQVFAEPSYLTVIDKTWQELSEECQESPSTVIAHTFLGGDVAQERVEASNQDGSADVKEKGDKGRKDVSTNGAEQHDSKRIKAEVAEDNSEMKSRNRAKAVPWSPRRAASQSHGSKRAGRAETRTALSKSKSEGGGAALLKGSGDDALWNASDTDESDE